MNDNKLNGCHPDSVVVTAVKGVPATGASTTNNDTLFANEYNHDVFTIDNDDAIVTKTENGLNQSITTSKPKNNLSGPSVSGVIVGTGAAVAPAVVGDGIHHERASHSFMFCCCDCRRATIIVNIINLCFAAIGLFGFIAFLFNAGNPEDLDGIGIDDGYTLKDYAPLVIVIMLLTMIGFILGILGAIKYKIWMIVIAIFVYCITAIFELLSFSIIGFIITGLFAYPHFVLVHEIRRGIMTKERYPIEQQSCCCV